ncbi:unnamed protein product, partial [Linum tenue]
RGGCGRGWLHRGGSFCCSSHSISPEDEGFKILHSLNLLGTFNFMCL